MNYWLVKQEPEAYSWNDLVKDKKTNWDGVRNYQARNNLRAMKKGDQLLFYHSVGPKTVVGVAQISREHFPDPTATSGDWSAVEVKPVKALKNHVSLAQIKESPSLSEMALIRHTRLSVMPVAKKEFQTVVKMGGIKL
jgi:predicted RNA-binding protein with PUA-like domain